MVIRDAIVGGPGCGKTSRVLALIRELVGQGVPMSQIAVLTFTCAARLELLERLERAGIAPGECKWVRTIHAMALRLRGRASLMGEADWNAFADLHGYDLSPQTTTVADNEADVPVPPRRTRDDALRFVYDWGRNRRLDSEQALSACPIAGVSAGQFRLYVTRYEAFKEENGKLDFADLLEHALQDGSRLPVRYAFVDEAQDLSAMQSALVEQWLVDCERVYVAGDDDQAVFTFQGGRADWFQEIARNGNVEVLAHSHRLPAPVLDFANAIIQRNANRIPKQYVPSDHFGEVLRMSREDALQRIDGARDTFVIVRNRFFLFPIAQELISRRVPYLVQGGGGPNPLGDFRLLTALGVSEWLRTGDYTRVSASDLDALLRCIAGGLVSKETRQAVKEAAKAHKSFKRDEVDELGLDGLIAALRKDGTFACLREIAPWKVEYLKAVIIEAGGYPVPKVELNSIHGVKGREADLVILFSDMTRATYDEFTSRRGNGFEDENRVFYVGATRTRSTLIVVEPRTRRYFDFPRLSAPVATSVRVPVECDPGSGAQEGRSA